MGLGLFTVAGLAAAVFAIVHHIVVKTTLFLAGGLIEHAGGSSRLSRLGGMVATAPVIAVLFLLPALSLAGIPPFSGFAAKFGLFDATARAARVGDPRRRRARQPADAVLDLQDLDRRVLEPAPRRRATTGADRRRRRAGGRAAARLGAAADARADRGARRADAGDRRRRRAALRLRATGPPPTSSTRRTTVRGGARRRAMRALGTVVGLAVIWVLLWGTASPANVLSGLADRHPARAPRPRPAPPPPRTAVRASARRHRPPRRLHARDDVRSNVELTREVLSPSSRIAHRRRRRAAARLLRRAADADHQPAGARRRGRCRSSSANPIVLYVHVLHLTDVEEVRAGHPPPHRPHRAGLRLDRGDRRPGRLHAPAPPT